MTAVKQQKKNNHEPCEKENYLKEFCMMQDASNLDSKIDKVTCLSVVLKYIIKKRKI